MCRMCVRLRIYCENTQFTFARPTRIRSGPRPWFPLVRQLERLHHFHRDQPRPQDQILGRVHWCHQESKDQSKFSLCIERLHDSNWISTVNSCQILNLLISFEANLEQAFESWLQFHNQGHTCFWHVMRNRSIWKYLHEPWYPSLLKGPQLLPWSDL